MRLDFCAPDLAQQQAKAAEFSASRIPEEHDGCI
jgi:hypothetical protein